MKKAKLRKLTFLGMLSAQAVILSFIENLLPPLPFLPPGGKAGFSNIITMYAAGTVGIIGALEIVAVKSIFVLFTRGVVAAVISLCGGVCSTLMMAAALKKNTPFGCIGVGVIGAAFFQLTQFLISLLLVGDAMVLYLPFMLLVAVITGCITGAVFSLTLPALDALKQKRL